MDDSIIFAIETIQRHFGMHAKFFTAVNVFDRIDRIILITMTLRDAHNVQTLTIFLMLVRAKKCNENWNVLDLYFCIHLIWARGQCMQKKKREFNYRIDKTIRRYIRSVGVARK